MLTHAFGCLSVCLLYKLVSNLDQIVERARPEFKFHWPDAASDLDLTHGVFKIASTDS